MNIRFNTSIYAYGYPRESLDWPIQMHDIANRWLNLECPLPAYSYSSTSITNTVFCAAVSFTTNNPLLRSSSSSPRFKQYLSWQHIPYRPAMIFSRTWQRTYHPLSSLSQFSRQTLQNFQLSEQIYSPWCRERDISRLRVPNASYEKS